MAKRASNGCVITAQSPLDCRTVCNVDCDNSRRLCTAESGTILIGAGPRREIAMTPDDTTLPEMPQADPFNDADLDGLYWRGRASHKAPEPKPGMVLQLPAQRLPPRPPQMQATPRKSGQRQ